MSQGRRDELKDLAVQPDTHAGLWIDRYLRFQTAFDATPDRKKAAQQAKDELVDQVCDLKAPGDYKLAYERWEHSLDPTRTVVARGELLGRTMVGLGAKGPAEFGVTLHRAWGVPVLPGSSLKGIAALGADRHLADDAWRRRPRHDESRTEPTPFDVLFGDPDAAGSVVFHDAWWVPASASRPLARDVVTVHHPGYYQADEEPSDADSPIPVPFVTASGSFLIALELVPGLDPATHGEWLRAAWTALRLGLERHGVGAKTNAGYGRVKLPRFEDTQNGKRVQQEQERVRGERAAAEARARLDARFEQRRALPPAARIDHVLQHEGISPLREWLRTGSGLTGLSGEQDEVMAAARTVHAHGQSKGLDGSHEPWRAWIAEALAPPPKTRRDLNDAERQELARPKNLDKLTKRLAAAHLTEDGLAEAIAGLEAAGAKGGQLRLLREALEAARNT
jgi:CRISPR-associated protein Cmr6